MAKMGMAAPDSHAECCIAAMQVEMTIWQASLHMRDPAILVANHGATDAIGGQTTSEIFTQRRSACERWQASTTRCTR